MSPDAAPADTRMMGIVHHALKRDLRRARDVLASGAPAAEQREALARHVGWVMEVLHAHHTSEDEGLWPLVRERNPGAAELLDSMEADHARIAPAAAAVVTAAAACATSPEESARTALVVALDDLLAVLVPHLDREVAEAMPVVSASITHAEWMAVEREHNLQGVPVRQLAMEGHWLLEDIDPEGYEVVVHTVPAPMRLLLLHGFGWVYRRQARARWGAEARPRHGVA